MGLLDQLWDETVAGPLPDSGLKRLRKYNSFSPSSSSPSAAAVAADIAPAVTRSITIVRPQSLPVQSPRSDASSVPSSPAASGTGSPFAPATTPKADNWRKFLQKPRMADVGPEATAGPRSPTVYDWVVISSLDR